MLSIALSRNSTASASGPARPAGGLSASPFQVDRFHSGRRVAAQAPLAVQQSLRTARLAVEHIRLVFCFYFFM